MNGFDDASVLATNGLRVGGEKYMMIAGEPGEVIRGKKGASGVTIKKTNSAVVIGIYGEGVTPGECNMVSRGVEAPRWSLEIHHQGKCGGICTALPCLEVFNALRHLQ